MLKTHILLLLGQMASCHFNAFAHPSYEALLAPASEKKLDTPPCSILDYTGDKVPSPVSRKEKEVAKSLYVEWSFQVNYEAGLPTTGLIKYSITNKSAHVVYLLDRIFTYSPNSKLLEEDLDAVIVRDAPEPESLDLIKGFARPGGHPASVWTPALTKLSPKQTVAATLSQPLPLRRYHYTSYAEPLTYNEYQSINFKIGYLVEGKEKIPLAPSILPSKDRSLLLPLQYYVIQNQRFACGKTLRLPDSLVSY